MGAPNALELWWSEGFLGALNSAHDIEGYQGALYSAHDVEGVQGALYSAPMMSRDAIISRSCYVWSMVFDQSSPRYSTYKHDQIATKIYLKIDLFVEKNM